MNRYFGFCDRCHQAKVFATDAARDEFESHACTHGYEPVSVTDSCAWCAHPCGDHEWREWREVGVGPCCQEGCLCRAYAVTARA